MSVLFRVVQLNMSNALPVSDLLSAHEAVFLLDVDVVNCVALFSPRLVSDTAIRPSHHTALTTRHLRKNTHDTQAI